MASKAVLITGSSSGIGEATALSLSAAGYTVFAGVLDEGEAEALKAKSTGELHPVILDVTNAGQIKDAAKHLSGTLGEAGLYALINNAGIVVTGPLEHIDVDQYRRQMEVNATGVLAVTQSMLPLLQRARGRIINIGSLSGRVTMPFVGAYSASKFALRTMSDTFRLELRHKGIRVSLIELGRIRTPIWESTLKTIVDDSGKDKFPDYKKYIESAIKLAKDGAKQAIDVKHAITAIRDAVESNNPRHTYVVGPDAKLLRLMDWILPYSAFESIIRIAWGLNK